MKLDEVQSFLDGGTSFEGKISFTGIVRIDGHFHGDARADGTLVVGEGGSAHAELRVGSLVVHGRVEGEVTARDRVEVGPTGVLAGKVQTPRLAVAEGAQITAVVTMVQRP